MGNVMVIPAKRQIGNTGRKQNAKRELLGHRMAEHPKFPLNTDHSISAPLRISPHYTIRIAQADPLQTIHLTVML